MRTGHTHFCSIRAAVNVNVAAHGVDIAQTVESDFATGKPENARQNPVALGELFAKLRGIHFPGGTAPDKYRVKWLISADLGANDMFAAWGAIAAPQLARTVLRGRNGVLPDQITLVIQQLEGLGSNANPDLQQFCPRPFSYGAQQRTGSTCRRIPEPVRQIQQ